MSAGQVLAFLNGIPALNGNVTSVTGPDGGPYSITFGGTLASQSVPNLTFSVITGNPTINVTSIRAGAGGPTPAQVQTNLQTIAALKVIDRGDL